MKSIAVYCSSSNKVDDIYKEEAKKVGNLLAKKGIRMVYGGGNPNCLGYANNLRLETQYNSASDHIVKYGASYYIDGGDRGTVKLFSHATDTPIDVYGSKRTFVVGTGATHVGLTTAASASEQPYISTLIQTLVYQQLFMLEQNISLIILVLHLVFHSVHLEMEKIHLL